MIITATDCCSARKNIFVVKKLPFPRTDLILAVDRVLPDGGGDMSRKAGNIKVVTAKKSWLESAASPGSAPSLGSRVLHQEGEVTSDK